MELKAVTDSSQVFKGAISGVPVTMQLNYTGVVDCHQYQHFVEGWYYYDKYQKKIPLTGIYDLGVLYLYNFGNKHKLYAKELRKVITSPRKVEKTDSIARTLKPKEALVFERNNTKQEVFGTFYMGKQSQPAILYTSNPTIYRYNNYLLLPDNKKLNTFDFMNRLGGNTLVSTSAYSTGNRVLLYFENLSNFNFCGMCGASDGEKGYRVLYFTKNWNYKNYEEFLTESCLEGISETQKIKTKDPNILQYNVKKSYASAPYILTVDVKNASVSKSK
ncbi:hypothetical protein [Chryseobacterium rhizosphaerae]|uniref:hypothetical protein n=1 Tax=Chryseobacterium rhizosphaerae TaxID=395937 RepID=UPI0019D4A999|nr:hypothetical protein [Chryseobacterium rhizosphaerae]